MSRIVVVDQLAIIHSIICLNFLIRYKLPILPV